MGWCGCSQRLSCGELLSHDLGCCASWRQRGTFSPSPQISTCSISQEQVGTQQAVGEKEQEIFQQLSYLPCIFLTKPTRKVLFEKFSTASNLRLYLWNFAHWVKILLHLWPGIVPANSIWNKSAKELLELPLWICLVSSSGLGVLISPSGSTWSCVKAKVKWDKHLNFLLRLAWLVGTRNLYSLVSALEEILKSKQMFLSLFWKPLFILLGTVSKEQLGVD